MPSKYARPVVAHLVGSVVYPATNEWSHGVPASVDAAFIAAANPVAVLSLLSDLARVRRLAEEACELAGRLIHVDIITADELRERIAAIREELSK